MHCWKLLEIQMVGVAAVSAILFFVGTAAALILPLLT